MIRMSRRAAAFGAGSVAVVGAVTAGTVLFGLSGGSASADLSPQMKEQIIKDCDDPQMVPDENALPDGNPIHPPHLVPNVICKTEPVEDLGHEWGPADKAWADGKDKPVPACETKARAGKSEGHTTGTNFQVGFQVGVDKEIPHKIKPQIQARFSWTFVNTRTSTYSQSFEIEPYHVGWYEVRPSLRRVKVNITANYQYRGKPEYKLENVELTTPDPDTQDAWVGRTAPMTDEELQDFCGLDEVPTSEPTPTTSPSGSPTDEPTEEPPAQEAKALVNVSTGAAADVDEGRSEVHAMPANQADGQKWNIKRQDDGRALIEPVIKPGYALGKNTDPTKFDQGIQPFAVITPDGEGAGQRWRLIGAGGDTYTVVDENGNCLTDPGNQGGTVGVFGCVGGDLQRWRLTGS